MFSVILANPPYNGVSINHKKLWPLFIKKALAFDTIAFVVPNSWVNSEKKQSKDIQELLWNKGTTFIEYDITKKYFPFIGEKICYFINKSGQSCWKVKDRSIYTNNLDVFKSDETKIWENIRDKVIHSSFPKIPLKRNGNVGSVKALSDDTSLARVYYSRSQYFSKNRRYADIPKDKEWSRLKIVFNRTAWTGKIEEYMFIDKDITTGCWASYYLLKDEAEGESIVSYLSTKLFQYLMGKRPKDVYEAYMNDWTVSKTLPLLPTKIYTDEDVYKLFGITEEEKREINKCFQ